MNLPQRITSERTRIQRRGSSNSRRRFGETRSELQRYSSRYLFPGEINISICTVKESLCTRLAWITTAKRSVALGGVRTSVRRSGLSVERGRDSPPPASKMLNLLGAWWLCSGSCRRTQRCTCSQGVAGDLRNTAVSYHTKE